MGRGSLINEKINETETKEYKRRLKLLLKSKLNGGNMIRAINTWEVAVISYLAEILDWTKEQMRNMDMKTRKITTIMECFTQELMCQGYRGERGWLKQGVG